MREDCEEKSAKIVKLCQINAPMFEFRTEPGVFLTISFIVHLGLRTRILGSIFYGDVMRNWAGRSRGGVGLDGLPGWPLTTY